MISLILSFSLCFTPWRASADADGTKQIAKLAVLTDNGERLEISAPGGHFKFASFQSGSNYWVLRSEVFNVAGRLALSGLGFTYGPYRKKTGSAGIVNIIRIPVIFEEAAMQKAKYSLGELKIEFFDNGSAQASVYPNNDEVAPSRVFAFPAGQIEIGQKVRKGAEVVKRLN